MNAKPNFRRSTPAEPSSPAPVAPTKAQTDFIGSLIDQIGEFYPEVARKHRDALNERYAARTLTKSTASGVIDTLKEQLAKFKAEGPKRDESARQMTLPGTEKKPEVPEGRYAIRNDDGDWAFYRVSVGKDGRVWVRVFSSDQTRPLPWKTALPILRKIESAGLQTARENFGKHSTYCYECGRRLTDEVSMSLGIGPKCRGDA